MSDINIINSNIINKNVNNTNIIQTIYCILRELNRLIINLQSVDDCILKLRCTKERYKSWIHQTEYFLISCERYLYISDLIFNKSEDNLLDYKDANYNLDILKSNIINSQHILKKIEYKFHLQYRTKKEDNEYHNIISHIDIIYKFFDKSLRKISDFMNIYMKILYKNNQLYNMNLVNNENDNNDNNNDKVKCNICCEDYNIDNIKSIMPCNHTDICKECVLKVDKCPFCRISIEKII